MGQALHKSGYSEAQITQQQPRGRIMAAKMMAIKTCSVQTNPDWSDLCSFPHFSVYGGKMFSVLPVLTEPL